MVSGSGIQNKILEALACALPVVTTTIGRGGIPAAESEGVVVADDATALADATSALLKDAERAHEAGRRGREFVLERYTWERNADAVERIYEEVSDTSRSRSR
jgi:glycosyltransferase involved in cell wall biosynthesis